MTADVARILIGYVVLSIIALGSFMEINYFLIVYISENCNFRIGLGSFTGNILFPNGLALG